MTIKCKPTLIKKMMIRMIVIGLVIVSILFLMLSGKWDFISIYTLSIAILAPMFVYVFYLNRFELIVIGIENGNVYLSFVNNTIYKRKDIKATTNDIVVRQEREKALLSIDGKLQAILRKDAMEELDWNKILQTLTKAKDV